MTYGEAYKQWLNEVLESEVHDAPCWLTDGRDLADIYEENDPTAFRCGFSGWFNHDNLKGMVCDECGDREIDTEYVVQNCDDDDDVLCMVCLGLAFECETCGGEFLKSEHESDTICDDCREAAEEEDEEDEETDEEDAE